MFRNASLTFATTAAAAAIAGTVGFAPAPAVAENVTFMTGPAGGSWYPLGAAMASLFEQEVEGLTVTLRPGAGLVNIKGVEEGKAHMGWTMVMSAVDAINGNEPFESRHTNICNLGSFYDNYFQMATSDFSVNTVADLKGKSLTTVPRGNTTELAVRALLATAGLGYDDLSKVNFASLTDGVNMMKDGQVDAIMVATSAPNGSLLDLSNSRKVKFLPVTDAQFDKLKAGNAGWERLVLRANTYPGQPEDVNIAGFAVQLIVGCTTLSEELAYKLTKGLVERGGELGSVVSDLKGLTADKMATDVGVPLHPGSLRAYKEAGVL